MERRGGDVRHGGGGDWQARHRLVHRGVRCQWCGPRVLPALDMVAWCCVGAGTISLAALWWMWPGLLPSPGTYWRGFVLSGIAVVAGVAAVWVKWAR